MKRIVNSTEARKWIWSEVKNQVATPVWNLTWDRVRLPVDNMVDRGVHSKVYRNATPTIWRQ